MKTLCLLFLLAALPVSAQDTNTPFCCRYPLRVLGPGQYVNLTPLCQWWIAHGGQNKDVSAAGSNYVDPQRPLTAWKRLKGVKTSDLESMWVVDAGIYTNPGMGTNEWIILRHPPVAEEERFYYLQSLLAEDSLQITNDALADKADLKAAQRADARANQDNGSYSKSIRQYSYDHGQRAAQDRTAAATALADEKQYEAGRQEVRTELAALPSVQGRYQIDCFALEVGRNSRGQMVFDAGIMYPAQK